MFKDTFFLKEIITRTFGMSRLYHINTLPTALIDIDAASGKSKQQMPANAIDAFINNLLQKNYNKLEKLRDDLKEQSKYERDIIPKVNVMRCVGLLSKSLNTDISTIRKSNKLNVNIRTLNVTQLSHLLESSMQMKNKEDFLYIIEECIRQNRLPSTDILLTSVKYLSTLAKVDLINSLSKLCETQQNPILDVYVDLAPFKAMALWRSGVSYIISLNILYDGYVKNVNSSDGKSMVYSAFSIIIEECLGNNCDAVLQSLVQIASTIYEKYNDIFVMACLWRYAFSSDWFSDQQLAAQLYESHSELRQLIKERSRYLCSLLLSKHNLNAVHRLSENYIKYKQYDACSICYSLLFNYHYARSNFRACTEIVKSCNYLNIELNEIQVKQFLDLILNKRSTLIQLPRTSPSLNMKKYSKMSGNMNDKIIQFKF